MQQDVEAGRGPYIDDRSCAAPVVTVPYDQPPVRVELLNGDRPFRRSLQAAYERVPLPDDAQPSRCRDASLVIERPGRDGFWELWHARRVSEQWYADYGGASQHAGRNPGYYTRKDWPGAHPTWGVSASSMTLHGGLLTLDDARGGSIDHAWPSTSPNRPLVSSPVPPGEQTASTPLPTPSLRGHDLVCEGLGLVM